MVCFFWPIIQIEDFKNEHCGKLQPNQINTISILLVDHIFFSQISSIEISRSSIMIERMVWAWIYGNYVSTTCWIFSNSKKKLKKNKNWKKKILPPAALWLEFSQFLQPIKDFFRFRGWEWLLWILFSIIQPLHVNIIKKHFNSMQNFGSCFFRISRNQSSGWLIMTITPTPTASQIRMVLL